MEKGQDWARCRRSGTSVVRPTRRCSLARLCPYTAALPGKDERAESEIAVDNITSLTGRRGCGGILRSPRESLSAMLARLEYARDERGRIALRERIRQVIDEIRRARTLNERGK